MLAWQAQAAGEDTLVISPTGSGKTLAAFLTAIDELARTPDRQQTSVVYISPLKALAADVEKTLAQPLRGSEQAAAALGQPAPAITVGMRTGDTSPTQRRHLIAHPPDILITTPESLFLMLSSAAARTMSGVRTVIVDELHTLAGTKRGAHLALSLERLAEMHPHQRIGLSATVSPPAAAAGFLSGRRPCTIVNPPVHHDWTVQVRSAVPDMTDLGIDTETRRANSIHPHVAAQILDLIDAHTSTLCFVNSRRAAERLTAQINELHLDRLGIALDEESPSEFASVDSTSRGGDQAVVARAHHGSVSKEHRAWIEEELKAGRLRCVVATSSLELGIDMGAIDLVVQVGAPESVSSALQRMGRAGHTVGGTSVCVWFPLTRDQLLTSAAVLDLMTEDRVEPVHELRNPLDVLTQHLVSMCLDRAWTPDALHELVTRASCFADLPRSSFDAVVDMLCGAYPSEEFSTLRARLIRDGGTLRARDGMRTVVATNAGTIPDRGAYPVLLGGSGADPRHPTRRIGEFDEEMVHETRVGDLVTLGTSSWLVETITANHIVVTPAAGRVGRLPFWHSDAQSRPAAIGMTRSQIAKDFVANPRQARARMAALGLDPWAVDNLGAYLSAQVEALGMIPDEQHIVMERFRDELGDWQVCIHLGAGTAVTSGLGLLIDQALRSGPGTPAQVTATDDGIIMRIPDADAPPPDASLLTGLPTNPREQLVSGLDTTAMFAARFRECAARSLVLPRTRPGKRSPLWQQRLRATQLLEVARNHPGFPITVETMRECLEDVLDIARLTDLLIDLTQGQIELIEVVNSTPSPWAAAMRHTVLAHHIEEGDLGVPHRGVEQIPEIPGLDELLGPATTQHQIDPDVVNALTEELQHLAPGWACDDAEAVWDMVQAIGPLTHEQILARCTPGGQEWVDQLSAAGRLIVHGRWLCTNEDFGWITPALTGDATALDRLVTRWSNTHAVFRAQDIAEAFDLDVAQLTECAERLAAGQGWVRTSDGYMTRRHWERARSRSRARARQAIRPVTGQQFASFLHRWHGLDDPGTGREDLLAAVDQLSGARIALSQVDLVLSSRVEDYSPGLLDELMASGEVTCRGISPLGQGDGWIELWGPSTPLHVVEAELSGPAHALLTRLSAGGAWTVRDLTETDESPEATTAALRELAWSGMVSCDRMAGMRDLLDQSEPRQLARDPRPGARRSRRLLRLPRPVTGGLTRWRAVLDAENDPATLALRDLDLLVDRQAIIARPGFESAGLPTPFTQLRRLATRLEERGELMRGWYCPELGGVQFTTPQVQAALADPVATDMVVLAASDPANPYGTLLDWPDADGPRPTRSAGAVVVLSQGLPLLHLERGHHSLICFGNDSEVAVGLRMAADRLGDLLITKVDGQPAMNNRRQLFETAGGVLVPQGWRIRSAAGTTG